MGSQISLKTSQGGGGGGREGGSYNPVNPPPGSASVVSHEGSTIF